MHLGSKRQAWSVPGRAALRSERVVCKTCGWSKSIDYRAENTWKSTIRRYGNSIQNTDGEANTKGQKRPLRRSQAAKVSGGSLSYVTPCAQIEIWN